MRQLEFSCRVVFKREDNFDAFFRHPCVYSFARCFEQYRTIPARTERVPSHGQFSNLATGHKSPFVGWKQTKTIRGCPPRAFSSISAPLLASPRCDSRVSRMECWIRSSPTKTARPASQSTAQARQLNIWAPREHEQHGFRHGGAIQKLCVGLRTVGERHPLSLLAVDPKIRSWLASFHQSRG